MITQPEVPFSLKDITVDWFTTALRESDIIKDEKVVSFTHKVIGEEAGFNGEVATGAGVHLLSFGSTDWLHRIGVSAFRFGSPEPSLEALNVEWLSLITP